MFINQLSQIDTDKIFFVSGGIVSEVASNQSEEFILCSDAQDQSKYQKIDFSDISRQDLATLLLEFKTSSAYDAMEHPDLAQAYIENPHLNPSLLPLSTDYLYPLPALPSPPN